MLREQGYKFRHRSAELLYKSIKEIKMDNEMPHLVLVSNYQLIWSLDDSSEEVYSMCPITGLFPVSCLTSGF